MLDKTWALLEALDAAKVFKVKREGKLYLDELGREATEAYPLYMDAKMEVEALRTLPPIMCLCGSTKFKESILFAAASFTMQGHIVLAPNVFGREAHDEGKAGLVLVNDDEKGKLDALHFRKIDLALRVHVVNVGGYIGESTHNEITYAVRNDKLVTFQEPTVIPWDTRRGDSIQTAHYLEGIRQRVALES